MVDIHSSYWVLCRPALKDLLVVTSIYHLAMKFPTLGRVTKVRGNQTKARACYMNALCKEVTCDNAVPSAMMIQIEAMDIEQEKGKDDMILDEGLNPWIVDLDSLA
ncbi:Uncharacterized protein Adt_11585 [Abeliophyllum distichum]|uniref:Uncharacterized protein n=1 Tax=Abeliophyllum distichum TaxID=126358 RepID=A0ABD1UN95_9LAMI